MSKKQPNHPSMTEQPMNQAYSQDYYTKESERINPKELMPDKKNAKKIKQ